MHESTPHSVPAGPSPFSADFDYPRPSDPARIDELFDELQARIGTTSAAARDAARGLDAEKKWTLIYNDAFMRWKNAREKLTHRPVEAKSAPAVGARGSEYVMSPRIGGGGGGSGRGDGGTSGNGLGTPSGAGDRSSAKPSWGKNESPEWYIGKFMDGTVTQQQVASLSVCLRTYELKCAYS